MDTVEQSLGAPRPEEMAALKAGERPEDAVEVSSCDVKSSSCFDLIWASLTAFVFLLLQGKKEWEPASSAQSAAYLAPSDSVSGWLSGITTKVQSGGLNLVSNSLDVLEGLGKKTMEVVGEKDPGFQKTKAVLTGRINQPVLSQVRLRLLVLTGAPRVNAPPL